MTQINYSRANFLRPKAAKAAKPNKTINTLKPLAATKPLTSNLTILTGPPAIETFITQAASPTSSIPLTSPTPLNIDTAAFSNIPANPGIIFSPAPLTVPDAIPPMALPPVMPVETMEFQNPPPPPAIIAVTPAAAPAPAPTPAPATPNEDAVRLEATKKLLAELITEEKNTLLRIQELEKSLQDNTIALNAKIMEINTLIPQLCYDPQEMDGRIKRAQASLESWTRAIANRRPQLMSLQIALMADETTIQRNNTRIGELSSQREMLQRQMMVGDPIMPEMQEAQIRSIDSEIARLKTENATLHTQIASSKKEIQTLEKLVITLEDSQAGAQEDLQELNMKKMLAMTEAEQKKQELLAQKRNEEAQLSMKNSSLTMEIGILKNRLQFIKGEISNANWVIQHNGKAIPVTGTPFQAPNNTLSGSPNSIGDD